MITELDREIDFDEKMLSIKFRKPFITWAGQVTWQMLTYDKEPQYEEPLFFLFKQSRKVMRKIKIRYNWTSARLYLLNLKLWELMRRGYHPQWSYDTKTTWRIKKPLSLFLHGSWLLNSARWWLMLLCHHAQSCMNLWSHDYR